MVKLERPISTSMPLFDKLAMFVLIHAVQYLETLMARLYANFLLHHHSCHNSETLVWHDNNYTVGFSSLRAMKRSP